MSDKFVGVRLTPAQVAKLEEIQAATGLNQSQVIRALVDAARIAPMSVEAVISPDHAPDGIDDGDPIVAV